VAWEGLPPLATPPAIGKPVTRLQDKRLSLRMKSVVLGVLLVVTACGSSPAPTAQSSPSATVTPSPAATVTPSPVALEGDLPVLTQIYDPSNGVVSEVGGFLHFPGAVFQRDPGAEMVKDSSTPGLQRRRTPDQPYLYADGSPSSPQVTYDRAVRRWLPVNRAQASDDGLRYAYVDYESESATSYSTHVVDIQSGSDQVVYHDTNRSQYSIVGLVQQNIYLADCVYTHTSPNCWGPLRRIDATTGAITKVSDRRGLWVISGQAAWLVTCWPAQTPVPCFGNYDQPESNQLLRIDLATGTEEIWDSGSGVKMIGIDGDGLPLVAENFVSPSWHGVVGPPWGDAGESVVFKITAPEHKERLFSVLINEPWAGFNRATADPMGIWLEAQYVPPGFETFVLYVYSKASGGLEITRNLNGEPILGGEPTGSVG
jgi:hypothetical protein